MTTQAQCLRAVLRLLGIALFGCLAARNAFADAPQRLLEAIEMRERDGAVEVIVRFMTPVRYLRHAPATRGDTIQVQIQPVRLAPQDAPLFASQEALAAPRDAPAPLIDVTYEGARTTGRYLVLRFSRIVDYEVAQGSDFRSLVVVVRARAAATDPALRVDQLMASGRAALSSGDLDQAIRVFTKVVSMPENPSSREAKELLGLARERRGQLAHAKAEYEEYLKWYPESEGATRVRQRLDAMLSATARPPERPGTARAPGTTPVDFQIFGSASTMYRREVVTSDTLDPLVTDSSEYTDLSVSTRARSESFLWRSLAAGSYRFDFTDDADGNETRVSSLFVDATQRSGPYAATLGRQPGNTAGVSSRFDGLRLARRVGEQWRISARGGFPVEIQNSDRVETRRYLYGLSLDGEDLGGHTDVQIFSLQQKADRMMDRTAVGGELRYADEHFFAASYVDYDVYFGDLNTALLTGNWQITRSTSLTFFGDYRNSPLLASWNALQGQPVDGLDELRELYSKSEIKALAEDRTPRSIMASLGGSQQITDRLQFAIDVSASYLSDTPASGGVDAMPSTGWEFSYYPQLVASNVFTVGDVGTLGVRYFDGSLSDTWSLIVNERYPITPKLRILPRLRLDWRNRSGRHEFLPNPDEAAEDPIAAEQAARARNGSFTVRPYLGIEWRVWKLTLSADAGMEWTNGSFDAQSGDELSYAFSAGVRYDF